MSRCGTGAAVLLLCFSCAAQAYSVLSHEAIVDAAWEDSIKPILLQRFPNTTPEDLLKAHAYVYGGSIIQDMGYYPFGSHLFSDLTHYIHSGDFIANMLAQSQDVNEYAFALGSLAHYAADNIGHALAVNKSVPILYPKVRRKFGSVATYEDNKTDHLRVEFAFDVSQVAEQHYAPDAYHAFIGFEVSKPLLERAFQATYGVPLTDVAKNLDLALGTYRWTVSSLIPEVTRAAWDAKKKEIRQNDPRAERRSYIYAISRSSFEKEWGTTYVRPGFGARLLAFLLRFIPKIGPLRSFAFHPATPETQKLFMDSFVKSLALYKEKLATVKRGEKSNLPNTNFDTGEPALPGTYRLEDAAAAKLSQIVAGQ
jgi:Zinc dependent phospholipase C